MKITSMRGWQKLTNDRPEVFSQWDAMRGKIRSSKGGWTVGEGIVNHGYSMLEDLVGDKSFFQVLVLNITGKLPEKRLATWLENCFICLSWPDPRIWCNQIGALGGDGRVSSVASVCAGTLASDSSIYGPGTVLMTTRFLLEAKAAIDSGIPVAQHIEANAVRKGRLMVPGFARPIATGDERVEVMQALSRKLGYSEGPMMALAMEISDYLYSEYGESINFGGYMCAFLFDQGMEPFEGYLLFSMSVNSGVHACYGEYRERTAGSFLPLHCEDIEYCGTEERAVPPA